MKFYIRIRDFFVPCKKIGTFEPSFHKIMLND